MTTTACSCGASPFLFNSTVAGIPAVQLRCACGPRSARVLCADPAQARRAGHELVGRGGAWPAGRAAREPFRYLSGQNHTSCAEK